MWPFNRHKDHQGKGKHAGPAAGQGTEATQPPSQQSGPDNPPSEAAENSDSRESRDYRDDPATTPEGPWRQAEVPQAPDPTEGRSGYTNPQTPQGYTNTQTPTHYQGEPSQTDCGEETTRAHSQEQDITGDVAGWSAISTEPNIAAPTPSVDITPDHGARVPGSTEGASSQFDAEPRGGSDTAAPNASARPEIVLPQPDVADPVDAEPRAFPEPLVIGDMPTLRSDPRGLPKPDQVPGPVAADSVLDGADFEGLMIRGASLRGDRHRYEATVRQDSMGIWRVGDRETPAILVCVTDGGYTLVISMILRTRGFSPVSTRYRPVF